MQTAPLTIEQTLEKHGKYVCPIVGVSMLPLLKEEQDSVVIEPKNTRLPLYSVALFRRGEQYVLHRVVKVEENGYYTRGDNTYFNEYVLEENVIGVMTGFFQGKEFVSAEDQIYLKYVKKRIKSYPVRRIFVKIKAIFQKLFKKRT
ncbi:MAG: S24/S26 family peptidase [Clostridia bacterium]|nr:S24/S26 family peptidase [Clostridia bacterium]